VSLDLFFDNFEQFTDVPYGIQRLREVILQLAVQGKLVPQDPNDEPASVLLDKIKTEVTKQTEERIISRGELVQLDKETIPFIIPNTWVWTRLGEIGRIVGGGTPRSGNPQYYADNGIPWLTPADLHGLKDKFIGRGRRNISELGLRESSAQVMPSGTVLFSSRAPIGYVAIASNDLATNQGFKSCVPFIIEMNEYIYYFLKAAAKEIESNATGTTFKEVSGKEVSQIPIPLPPLDEQHRIVAKLDQLMALCDDLEAQQKKSCEMRVTINNTVIDHMLASQNFDDFAAHWQRIHANFDQLYDTPETIGKLRQAILQLGVQGKLVPQDPNNELASALLNKIRAEKVQLIKEGQIKKEKTLPQIEEDEVPFALPDGWEWARLNDIIVFGPTNGFSPKAVEQATDVKSITLSATTSGRFDGRYFKYIDHQIDKTSYLWLHENDLLIQRGNSIEYVGVPAIYRGPSYEFIYPDLIMKIRVSEQLSVDFVHQAMSCEASRNYLRLRATGTSGSMPKINQGTLISLPIPIPPLAEQHRIVAKVARLMSLCDELEDKLHEAKHRSSDFFEVVLTQVFGITFYRSKEQKLGLTKQYIKQQDNLSEEQLMSSRNLRFNTSNPAHTVEEIVECLDALGGVATPERLLTIAGLSEDVERFFDLLREGRDSELLIVPTGADQVIRRNDHEN
jgi:type I restriction enzyme S subunit